MLLGIAGRQQSIGHGLRLLTGKCGIEFELEAKLADLPWTMAGRCLLHIVSHGWQQIDRHRPLTSADCDERVPPLSAC
jgi:hypothetical protein